MATIQTPKDFKAFDKVYAKIKAANRADRVDGVGLMTPQLLKRHLKSGQDLVLAYGRRGETLTYTLADLKAFDDAIKRSAATNKSAMPGVPLLQLEALSRPEDKRKVAEIRSAMFYRISGNVVSFQVTASPKSDRKFHQVRVRLDSWEQRMLDAPDFITGSKQAAVGNISFDCTCGRHQYWYRYLATLGNFALDPKEKDFPKIRNPKLMGCCCKHVLKVLKVLKSGTIHGILAKEMEKQAASVGYMDKKSVKYLAKTDLAKAKRAKGTAKDTAEAKRAYRMFQKAGKAFQRKMAQADVKATLARQAKELQQNELEKKALERRVKDLERQKQEAGIADKLRGYVAAMADVDVARDVAFNKFAAKYNVPMQAVEDIAKRHGI